jgi:hypothetical protein
MLALAGGLLTLAVGSNPPAAQTATGSATARRLHETVVVSAIDRDARTVTLLNAEGEPRTVGVPPDMRSFDTLKFGDHVGDTEEADQLAAWTDRSAHLPRSRGSVDQADPVTSMIA